jgi:D-lactate dehydrogenase (cytochrome)
MDSPASTFATKPLANELVVALQALLGDRYSTRAADLELHGHGESYHATKPPQAVCHVKTTEEVSEIV